MIAAIMDRVVGCQQTEVTRNPELGLKLVRRTPGEIKEADELALAA